MRELVVACRDSSVEINEVLQILDKLKKENREAKGINSKDAIGESPLRWACVNGNSEVVKILLKRGALVNILNNMYQTPLHASCWNQHSSCVSLLLASGADINFQDKDGCTALHNVYFILPILLS